MDTCADKSTMVRNSSIDYLKIILAVLVIGLHTRTLQETSPVVSFFLVNGLFRVAVPLFLIVSGYFFASIISEQGRVSRWAAHLFVMYVIWMLIYLPFYLPTAGSPKQWQAFAATIFTGYFHLWFLVAALMAGLILTKIRNQRTSALILTGTVLFLSGTALQYFFHYGDFSSAILLRLAKYNWMWRNFLFVGLPFMIVGYVAAHDSWLKRAPAVYIVFALLTGAALMALETLTVFYLYGDKDIDLLFSLMVVCPAIFLFAMRVPSSGKTENLAAISTGMYLVHPLIIFYLSRRSGLSSGTTLFACCLAAAIPAAWLLAKLKLRFRWLL